MIIGILFPDQKIMMLINMKHYFRRILVDAMTTCETYGAEQLKNACFYFCKKRFSNLVIAFNLQEI